MLEFFSNANLWFYQNRSLFTEPNNYIFDRAAQGQLSKCDWRNTATTLRTLLQSHKCLKETESPNVALVKNCFEDFHRFHMKELLMKSFLSWVVACNFTEETILAIQYNTCEMLFLR